jgi:geranylgeranyl pyrophosphate synthase
MCKDKELSMSGGFPVDLILFAMVAAFLVLRLRSVLGRSEAEGLRLLRTEFPLEHAIAYAMEEAQRRIAKAQASLTLLPAGPARDALHQLAGFVLLRRL